MANLVLNGFLQAGGEGCGCGDSGSGVTERLGLRCSPSVYQSIVETSSPIRVQTTGKPGDEFVDLAILGDFVGIEFLYLKTNSPMVVCIDAGAAELTSDPLTLPTGFVGGETMTFVIDSVTTVVVTFLAGDQTLVDVVNRINAACALAGLPTPRCVAVGTNRIKIIGIACGFDPNAPSLASVVVVSSPAQIPFATSQAFAQGSHLDVAGTFLVEFPQYPDAPKRVEISGQGSVTVLAAGRTSP